MEMKFELSITLLVRPTTIFEHNGEQYILLYHAVTSLKHFKQKFAFVYA